VSLLGPLTVRRVGLASIGRARARIDAGESPTRDVIDGVVRLAGGLLVCVPGFVSDAAGLALLIGPVRHLVIRIGGHRVGRRLVGLRSSRWGVIDVTSHGFGPPPPPSRRGEIPPTAPNTGSGDSPGAPRP
ncbi:MAG TPA: FxsA family protein, partial [Acidimicrobiales bacterium]|nr:FxsA family protein [Acidimicrobiales bacterium]